MVRKPRSEYTWYRAFGHCLYNQHYKCQVHDNGRYNAYECCHAQYCFGGIVIVRSLTILSFIFILIRTCLLSIITIAINGNADITQSPSTHCKERLFRDASNCLNIRHSWVSAASGGRRRAVDDLRAG